MFAKKAAVIASAAVAMGAGALASPAHADTFRQSCGGDSNFKVCVSYNYTTRYVAANVFNRAPAGNAVRVTLTLDVDNSFFEEDDATFWGQTWWGIGGDRSITPRKVCAGLFFKDTRVPLAGHCSSRW